MPLSNLFGLLGPASTEVTEEEKKKIKKEVAKKKEDKAKKSKSATCRSGSKKCLPMKKLRGRSATRKAKKSKSKSKDRNTKKSKSKSCVGGNCAPKKSNKRGRQSSKSRQGSKSRQAASSKSRQGPSSKSRQRAVSQTTAVKAAVKKAIAKARKSPSATSQVSAKVKAAQARARAARGAQVAKLRAARSPTAAAAAAHAAASKPGRRRGRPSKHERTPSLKRSVSGTVLVCSMQLQPSALQAINMTSYIRKMFRERHPDLALKRDSLEQMDALVKNLMHYFASTASGKLGRRKTLSAKQLSRAIKKSLPRRLRSPVMERAQEAIKTYESSTGSKLR